eukprot:Nitzschia sp. Nitz4//scaffold356_size15932//2575//6992//NITZ4_008878-RA/size15932-snap-gene-0.1-mRNA-1//-1//CDS//3329548961//2873//frame0
MGVPKFFRWLSERYPKMNQRFGSAPNEETCQRYFDGSLPPPPVEDPDPLSTCGLPPPVDRLYIDMNGIIHGCSHSNNHEDEENARSEDIEGDDSFDGSSSSSSLKITNEEIFRNVCYYLDRIIGDMVKPTEMVYLAIDGVAPRAKLNQQRSRRYRSGREGQIETNIYEAHAKAMEDKRVQSESDEELYFRNSKDSSEASPLSMDDGFSYLFNNNSDDNKVESSSSNKHAPLSGHGDDSLTEIAPGRFKGKFETKDVSNRTATSGGSSSDGSSFSIEDTEEFHSNVITPGTPFFQEFSERLEIFLKHKVSTDPNWKNLTIVFSGPNVPGEGEHKLMDFIRKEKARPDYNPNLRHCIVGQDGDLIMLGLATHEPNLVLLRERVVFSMAKRRMATAHYSANSSYSSLDAYLHNGHFEFLHMGVLRDYLAFEFETSNILSSSPYDLERTIDDFVFMTFFVGNDFLPHMPALDIADQAFDLLFYTYKQCRKQWLQNGSDEPYLTNAGNIVSGKRLEEFLTAVGSHEVAYYDKKKVSWAGEQKRLKASYKRWGVDGNIPDADLVASKEESDRAAYRRMLLKEQQQDVDVTGNGLSDDMTKSFSPVMSGDFQPLDEEDELEEGIISKMGNLLQNSLSGGNDDQETLEVARWEASNMDDQDLKGRYYYDKFQFSPFDAEKHTALRKAYVEGLVWCLKYYYEGCVSWEWYFPYHYGPMLSDLVNLDEILDDISFEGKLGEPLRPFEQLMGCMPPSQALHLPEPYQWLMTEAKSPIIDFYPRSFTIDMNGKRWPWEAVVLLPFIDSKRLLEAASQVNEDLLTPDERARNSLGEAYVLKHDDQVSEELGSVLGAEKWMPPGECNAKIVPYSEVAYTPDHVAVLEPKLTEGLQVPLPGFGSLRDAPVKSLWRRKLGIDVFCSRSRYKTACLEMYNLMPPLPPIEDLAPKLIGTTVFINYPYSLEALVTAVSNETTTVRGPTEPRTWTARESEVWRTRRDGGIRQFLTGEGLTGTGGLVFPNDQPMTLSVRPFQKMVTLKNGQTVKTYANFEVEVPLMATFWNPSHPDPRLNVPSRLEKNAFELAAPRIQPDGIPKVAGKKGSKRLLFPPRKQSSSKPKAATINGHATRNFSTGVLPFRQDFSATRMMPAHTDRTSRPMPNVVFPRKAGQTTRLGTSLKFSGSAKGKVVAAGVLAFGFLTGSANGISTPMLPSHHLQPLIISPFQEPSAFEPTALKVVRIRGGNTELSTEIEEASTTPPLEFAHGTTTLSFVYKEGIVVAVDSRASLGSFVGSKTTQKILPVNGNILGTMAGGAADCMHWIRHLKSKALSQELTGGSRMTVERASRLLSNALLERRDGDLSVGTMIMGYNENDSSPRIYYVDNSGKRIRGDIFAVGSGSSFALGILDKERRFEMTEEEAIALAIKAIRHATFRDSHSGGYINVYLIKESCWKCVYTEDIAGFK